ncbi:MAG: FAD-dependent monooxygenase [Myxococcota bacterium]|nr:FAD-dependent monooxygenase [Myxococcota bacterium]
MTETPVLIAGGGPIGLLVAIEMHERGVPCLLVEKALEPTAFPKMDITNVRSMEHFRRLGIADDVRKVAVPPDHNFDVVYCTRHDEWELARFPYASPDEMRALSRARNDGTQAAEPYMRLAQSRLERLLREKVDASGVVEARWGQELVSLEQDREGVTSTLRNVQTGEEERVRSQYVAGCDGGGSAVREALGIPLVGEFSVGRLYMIHFRSTDLDLLQRFGQSWHVQSPACTLIAQDDEAHWTAHLPLPPGTDESALDPRAMLVTALGREFEFEVLLASLWSPHLVTATRYGAGRVWLAGDSAHQLIPTGGYGMNTGVVDAANLSWKMAAVVQGWGGPALLDSIDAEQRPIGVRSVRGSRLNMQVRLDIQVAYLTKYLGVHADDAEGARLRRELGRTILDLGNEENESFGIELGHSYWDSPVICQEGWRPDDPRVTYAPTTLPGHRLPHLYVDGTPVYDRLGPGFSLLCLADDLDASGFEKAAAERSVPLDVVRLCDDNARKVYERDLILVRPDQHVCWRSNDLPFDPGAILDRVRGA